MPITGRFDDGKGYLTMDGLFDPYASAKAAFARLAKLENRALIVDLAEGGEQRRGLRPRAASGRREVPSHDQRRRLGKIRSRTRSATGSPVPAVRSRRELLPDGGPLDGRGIHPDGEMVFDAHASTDAMLDAALADLRK